VTSAMRERRTAGRSAVARRRGCVGAALLFLTVALSGCLSLKSNSASQTTPGKITLKVVVCASNYKHAPAPAPDWTDCQPGNVGKIVAQDVNREDAVTGGFGQILVGFRVPLGTVGPTAFSSKDGATDFTLSPSYTTELQRLFPAPGDQQWIGYISTVREYKPAVPASRVGELNVEFRIPKSADGNPLATFRWRPVAGFRQGGNADAPVACGNDAVGKYCVDSPPRAQMDDITTDVSDFGVLAGASATAYAGTTARVPFGVRYSDKAGLGRESFAVTATTDVPNSRAVAEPGTVDAAPNSTNTASALVAVPAGTPGGRYTVTLSAAAGAPPIARENKGTIFVQPLPPGPPPSPINSSVNNQWTAFKSGTRVDKLVVTNVPAGGTVTARCRRGRGSCKFTSKSFSGRRTVNLKPLFRKRKLKPKTVVEVSITADKRIGKLVRYTVRKKPQIPTMRTLCEPPGSPKPLACVG
jgi:hypothetical protein